MENDIRGQEVIARCAEPEFFGRIPVRTEITVLPPDDPTRREVGWTLIEITGIAVCNAYAVLPWYRKIFRGRFWVDLFEKLFPPR